MESLSGYFSKVENLVANEELAGSIPVIRSMGLLTLVRQGVCKTSALMSN